MKIRPIHDRILAKRLAEEGKTAGGLFIPDLVLAGVIDPTKVARVALQNAASVASLMLTTEVLIAERNKNDKETAGAEAHGDMGEMGM